MSAIPATQEQRVKRSARARLAIVIPVALAAGCSLMATPRDEATRGNRAPEAGEMDGQNDEPPVAQDTSAPQPGDATQETADVVEVGAPDVSIPPDTSTPVDAADASIPCSCTLPHTACGEAGACRCLPNWGNCSGGAGCPDDLTTGTNCGICGLACNACCGTLCLTRQTCQQLPGGSYACQC